MKTRDSKFNAFDPKMSLYLTSLTLFLRGTEY